jgi:hypothetical protein
MAADGEKHLLWITRLVRGELINGQVGIPLRGGPFDGQVRIVQLDDEGNPPATTRGRRGSDLWHRYRLVVEGPSCRGWVYEYDGAGSDNRSCP